MRSVLIANGEIKNIQAFKEVLLSADRIICIDGGLKYLKEVQVEPTVIIGDLDSTEPGLLSQYAHVEKKTFPVRKDATDSELAIELAIDDYPDELILLGMTGKRLDHGLTNLHLLRMIPERIHAYILDEHNKVYYCKGVFETKGSVGDILSIIPISLEVKGITTSGLEYPLKDETLYLQGSRGVSNVLDKTDVKIETLSGEFFVILSKD